MLRRIIFDNLCVGDTLLLYIDDLLVKCQCTHIQFFDNQYNRLSVVTGDNINHNLIVDYEDYVYLVGVK